jgi:hypothetical protein
MSPNATCNISLESYNPYLQPQKVLKIQKFIAFTVAYPKVQKAVLATIIL